MVLELSSTSTKNPIVEAYPGPGQRSMCAFIMVFLLGDGTGLDQNSLERILNLFP